MKFLIPFVRHSKVPGIKTFSRTDVLLWGMLGVGVLFLGLIAWDGYLFYATVMVKNEVLPLPPSTKTLSQKDIDAVVRLIDSRALELDKLLEGK